MPVDVVKVYPVYLFPTGPVIFPWSQTPAKPPTPHYVKVAAVTMREAVRLAKKDRWFNGHVGIVAEYRDGKCSLTQPAKICGPAA